MVKLLAGFVVVAALILLTPAVSSAASKSHGLRTADPTEFSAQRYRRAYRRGVYVRPAYRPWRGAYAPRWGVRRAYWGPRRAYWGPRWGVRRAAVWGPGWGYYRPWRATYAGYPYWGGGWGAWGSPWASVGYRPWGWRGGWGVGYRPWGWGWGGRWGGWGGRGWGVGFAW